MHNAMGFVITLALATSALACSASDSAEPSSSKALVGRTYVVRAPAGYDGSHPVPLVVALHGYANDAAGIEPYFGFDPVADAHGFVVVYPDGTLDKSGRRFFNATDACCDFDDAGIDDVAFIDALVDDIEAKYNIDANRVYAVGHSNGGFMSYRLACDLSSRFAAIVSLEGAMWNDASRCRPSEVVSVLQIEGTNDATIPPSGGNDVVGNPNRVFPSTEQTLADWRGFDAASGDGVSGPDPGAIDSETSQGTVVTTWSGNGADVELWMIQGGTHSPPLTALWAEDVYAFLSAHPKSKNASVLSVTDTR